MDSVSRRGFFGWVAAAAAGAVSARLPSAPPAVSACDIEKIIADRYAKRFAEYMDSMILHGDGTACEPSS
jgi:hypothetical protein